MISDDLPEGRFSWVRWSTEYRHMVSVGKPLLQEVVLDVATKERVLPNSYVRKPTAFRTAILAQPALFSKAWSEHRAESIVERVSIQAVRQS